jgi:hypothetical protein
MHDKRARSTPRLLGALLAAVIFSICFGSAAYAGYNVWTGDYLFSKQELDSGIQSYFPRDLAYLQLVQVRLSHPELALDVPGNRVITKLNAHVGSPFLAAPLDALLTISSGLKYDAATRAIRLDRPVLERIDAPGLPAAYAAQMNDIGKTAAAQALAGYPLYTFKPEELQMNGQQFEPGAITVTADGVKVEIHQQ